MHSPRNTRSGSPALPLSSPRRVGCSLALGVGTSLALAALVPRGVHAEAPHYTTTWSQEALAGLEPAEVEQTPQETASLRALRLAEEELFHEGAGEDGKVLGTSHESTEAPPTRLERPGGASVDLSFLKGLKLPALPVRWDTRVIEYLLFFKDDPRGRELAAAWLKRRERYGPMIRRILSEHGLPDDVQYLAMIESGYDPLARSHADAWGMWQFVKQPAEFYGLRVDHWVDERLDPERATRAAARFLRDLHERFGSWDLAFASYNMGYGGLLRAIKKYNTNDYWTLSHLEAALPFETSLYVAKITAMALVGHNPERFGFGKLAHDAPLALAKVDAPPGTPLADVAAAAGLTLAQLKAVNPHVRQNRVPPGAPSAQLFIPREAQVRFVQRWTAQHHGPHAAPYLVRFGESLEDVAKRCNMPVAKLRELNELGPDVVVKPGFALLVPPGSEPTSDLVESLVATVPDKTFHEKDKRRVFYRVARDDTPATVARFFSVSTRELAEWNGLSERAALHAGMLLQLFVAPELDLSRVVVYEPNEVRILTVGSNEFFDYHEGQRGRVRVRYRVRAGDSIETLAERFGLSAGSIGRINQFPSNRELKAGEWLVVYVAEDKVAELDAKGSIERIGRASAPVAAREREITRDDGDELVERKRPQLPEVVGEKVKEPKPESPIPPRTKRADVVAPTKPLVRAPKQATTTKRQL